MEIPEKEGSKEEQEEKKDEDKQENSEGGEDQGKRMAETEDEKEDDEDIVDERENQELFYQTDKLRQGAWLQWISPQWCLRSRN
ncbi:hypothetical protein ACOMHN_028510 [Nucella lapillus]